MNLPGAATFIPADRASCRYVEKVNPRLCNLKLLSFGVYELRGPTCSGLIVHPEEESLLFGWKGGATILMGGTEYSMARYDVLYVPRGETYRLVQDGGEASLILCRAVAEHRHPPFHARWAEFSVDEKRIRRLKGKDVYLMFDVSEPADRLMAGFTLFQPHQRSWPPHNHTDQEEIYIFTRGRGSMEVYADEETKTFVHSVHEGDAVAIPVLNYHPVFTQDEELDFIWCIAGNRYWVGDRNKDFMNATVDRLTT